MDKTLCDLEELLKKDFAAYCRLVDQPRFVCTHCGRAANKKKNLCKPKLTPLAKPARISPVSEV